MQVVLAEDGTSHMGLLTQVTPTSNLQICGDGFNPATVKVRIDGAYYFVFRQDLEDLSEKTVAANA